MGRKVGSKNLKPPAYREHKGSGRGVVTVNGRTIYLEGKYNSPESRAAYHRLMSTLAATGGIEPQRPGDQNGPTVNEVIATYWTKRVLHRYPTDEDADYSKRVIIRSALNLLAELYGPTRAKDFDSAAYLAVREAMILRGRQGRGRGKPLMRRTVNSKMWRIIEMFKWAAVPKLVPATIFPELVAAGFIEPGQGGPLLRESEIVTEADPASVEATLPHLPKPLQAAVRLQRLTGMRSNELLVMRGIDIDMTPDVYGNWTYRPSRFKNQRRRPGYVKEVPLGPAAQEVVRGLLKTDMAAYLISPIDVYCRSCSTSVGKPEMVRRRPPKHGRRQLNQRYSVTTYANALARACGRAEAAAHRQRPDVPAETRIVKAFHPHQLRHLHATEVAMAFDREMAAAALDHSSPTVTQRYDHSRRAKARIVAAKVG